MKKFTLAIALAIVACLAFTADSEAFGLGIGRLRVRRQIVVERVVVQRQPVVVQQQVFVPTFAVVQPVFAAQVVVPVQPLVSVQVSPVILGVGVCR